MRPRLYLVLHSPFECNCAEKIELFSGNAEAGVLLVEDGVYHAVVPQYRKELHRRNLKVYALRVCMEARGFEGFNDPGVEMVDATRAVQLIMEEYDGVIRM